MTSKAGKLFGQGLCMGMVKVGLQRRLEALWYIGNLTGRNARTAAGGTDITRSKETMNKSVAGHDAMLAQIAAASLVTTSSDIACAAASPWPARPQPPAWRSRPMPRP